MSTSECDRELGLSRSVATPIYPSSVYSLPDLDALERINDGVDIGFSYARDKHPNAADLAARVATLHDATWGVITASGMGAITASLLSVLKAGDRIVASDQLYGGTAQLVRQQLPRFGVKTTLVDVNQLDSVRQALGTPAKVLLVETISNPVLRVSDLTTLAELAHSQDTLLFVDNTFATPVLCRPLSLGADMVVESLTKLIGGHSDTTLGGAFGRDAKMCKAITSTTSIWGMNPSPFDCWLAVRSLSTLSLRVRAASENAMRIATWLSQRPGIRRVIYPGLANHPDQELAKRLLAEPPANIVSFELIGGRDAVNGFMRRGNGIPFSPSLGDSATSCSYPFGTSHRFVEPDEKRRLGITDGLVRLSVGIEPIEEIIRAMQSKLEG